MMKTTFDTVSVQSAFYKDKAEISRGAQKAAENFESYFVSLFLNELQKTASFSKKGFMEQNYMTMINQKVSEFIANKGIGIKDVLVRYLERQDVEIDTKVPLSSADNSGNNHR